MFLHFPFSHRLHLFLSISLYNKILLLSSPSIFLNFNSYVNIIFKNYPLSLNLSKFRWRHHIVEKILSYSIESNDMVLSQHVLSIITYEIIFLCFKIKFVLETQKPRNLLCNFSHPIRIGSERERQTNAQLY